MTSQYDRNAEERFTRAWKEWLDRPMKNQPSEAAARATEVLQHRRQSHPRWIPLTAAAALACVLGFSIFLVLRQPGPPERRFSEVSAPAPLGNGEILIWIDERTPLYMTFQAPDAPSATGGKR